MDKRRPIYQIGVFIGISLLIVLIIVFFKNATARPVPGTAEDSAYQAAHGPVAIPDTTLEDTTLFASPDTFPTDSLLLDSLLMMGAPRQLAD